MPELRIQTCRFVAASSSFEDRAEALEAFEGQVTTSVAATTTAR